MLKVYTRGLMKRQCQYCNFKHRRSKQASHCLPACLISCLPGLLPSHPRSPPPPLPSTISHANWGCIQCFPNILFAVQLSSSLRPYIALSSCYKPILMFCCKVYFSEILYSSIFFLFLVLSLSAHSFLYFVGQSWICFSVYTVKRKWYFR